MHQWLLADGCTRYPMTTAVIELDSRGDCRPLVPMTRVGLEPTTYGLKVRCSAS